MIARRVSLAFGGIAMAAGVLGVPLGALLGGRLIKRFPRAHPLICGVGLLISAPCIGLAIFFCNVTWLWPFILIFIGEIALNLNWSIVADLTLYVVIPPRRSTAEAFQILISHMLGDAGSPYLVGLISESLKKSLSNDTSVGPTQAVQFISLQYALFVTIFVEVVGAAFFFLTAMYVVRDKNRVARAIAEADAAHAEITHSSASAATERDERDERDERPEQEIH
ncbi:hypothetical protein O0L34_g5997 [Tuta absoluta]|nr:hypothetical protein O0L34_g5997 [Tuta absoluta]